MGHKGGDPLLQGLGKFHRGHSKLLVEKDRRIQKTSDWVWCPSGGVVGWRCAKKADARRRQLDPRRPTPQEHLPCACWKAVHFRCEVSSQFEVKKAVLPRCTFCIVVVEDKKVLHFDCCAKRKKRQLFLFLYFRMQCAICGEAIP